jgi:hypothetical protein
LKSRSRSRFKIVRDRFILTPEEKRVIVFVVVAFSLGLVVKHYRQSHPRLLPADQKPHVIQESPRKKARKKSMEPPGSILQSPTPADDQG